MTRQLPSELAELVDGAWIESYPRSYGHGNNAGPASGRIRAAAVWLNKGWEISAIRFFSGTTAGTTLTHSWAGVWDHATGALVGVSADDVTTPWAAESVREFGFATPLLIPDAALYWVGRCVVATVVPSTIGPQSLGAASRTAIWQSQTPALVGETTATFTTPGSAPDPIVVDAAAAGVPPYCVVL